MQRKHPITMFSFLRRGMATLLVVLGAVLMTVPASAETVTGTFRYSDFNPADGSVQLRPIQFCRVEVWGFRPRFLGIWGWAKDADTATDGNGSISLPFSFQTAGVIYGVRITAENYAAVVWPNQFLATGPFWTEPGVPDGAAFQRTANSPGAVLDFSYDFTDDFTPQHWSLADAVRHGFDYVSARRDPNEADPLPKAPVQPGFFTTFYNPINSTLEINGVHIWEDFTIIHEYAHFIEHQIGSFVPIATVHDGCTAKDAFGAIVNSPEHAWMEGFAEFFAQAAARNAPFGAIRGHPGDAGTFTVADLENTPWTRCSEIPANVAPNAIENVVAGVLWDLLDPSGLCGGSESHDEIGGFDTQVIQIMDRELDLPRGPTIDDFAAAWFGRQLPAEPMLNILRRHGLIPALPLPSVSCPGDITVNAPLDACSAVVTFATPTLNQNRRCAAVFCNPPSGASFRSGVTTVTCRATENFSEIASCSFNVTVSPNPGLPNPNGTGLLGVYYDNIDLTAPRVARTEAVNFEWAQGAPASGIDPDTFSVRWTGKLVPRYSDLYRIFTVSDDGIRLWIDGILIMDAWNDHPPTEYYGDITLQAGVEHDVVLEMYENGGGATAKLLWQSSCQAKETIPASHLLPGRLDRPVPNRPTFEANFVYGAPPGMTLFGKAVADGGWLKLTKPDTDYGVAYIDNFSGAAPVYGFEASFKAALFGATCCGNGAFPADGFSFNLVPASSVVANPAYNQPGEEGLDTGLAINFDTWDNGGGEGPAVEVKWRGQIVTQQYFQPSQSPVGAQNAREASRDVSIQLTSDGRLTVSYGGVRVLDHVQTPYTPQVIGTPKWVLGARTGGANDNHWIRDLRIVVNRPTIPGLFSTGVDDAGRRLADNVQDPHCIIPLGQILSGAYVATSAGGFPIGPWLADNASSGWIAPTLDTYSLPNSDISYTTSFNLNGLLPGSAAIHGWVAADDALVDVLLNGVSTGIRSPAGAVGGEPFTSWQAFAITSGFQPGANTLTFVTRNGPSFGTNPSGVRAQLCGFAGSEPLMVMNISPARRGYQFTWGALPHKQYFFERSTDLNGPWTRDSTPIAPGSYRVTAFDFFPLIGGVKPVQFYRVVEVP